MTKFLELSANDLVQYTAMLHLLKPETRGSYVYGIEQPQSEDLSIVFHLADAKKRETIQVILSTEYILEKLENLVVS